MLPGITIHVDGGVTGNFRVLCDGEHAEGKTEARKRWSGGPFAGDPVPVRQIEREFDYGVLLAAPGHRTSARLAISATRRSIVGHSMPWRAPARRTAPGIASSSGSVRRRCPAASSCLEWMGLARARLSARTVRSARPRPRHRTSLLDRPDQLRTQLRGGADLAKQLVEGAGRAGKRVQAHELRPHHLRLRGPTRVGMPASFESLGQPPRRLGERLVGPAMSISRNGLGLDHHPGARTVGFDPDRAGEHRLRSEAARAAPPGGPGRSAAAAPAGAAPRSAPGPPAGLSPWWRRSALGQAHSAAWWHEGGR